jgi:hypothetical protein
MTVDTGNTYDGTHYSEAANATIARHLLEGDPAGALDLKKVDAVEMRRIYSERLKQYDAELKAGLEG